MPIKIKRKRHRRKPRPPPRIELPPPGDDIDGGVRVMTLSEFHDLVYPGNEHHPYRLPIKVLTYEQRKVIEDHPRVDSLRQFKGGRMIPWFVDRSQGRVYPDCRWLPHVTPGDYSFSELQRALGRGSVPPSREEVPDPPPKPKRRLKVRLRRR